MSESKNLKTIKFQARNKLKSIILNSTGLRELSLSDFSNSEELESILISDAPDLTLNLDGPIASKKLRFFAASNLNKIEVNNYQISDEQTNSNFFLPVDTNTIKKLRRANRKMRIYRWGL